MKPKSLKSLQEICVDSVVEHFEFLISIYNSESARIPRRHFEFLQRIYSEAVLDKICAKNVLQDNFVCFLINPYLKKLDVKSDCFQNPHIIIEQLKIVGSNIISVDMRGKYFAEEVIMELVSLVPNVEKLYLSQTKSTDNVLMNIGKYCSQLRTLDVCLCDITKGGLISLCLKDENGEIKPNYLLKKLYITGCDLKEDGVFFALTHFPSLEVLGHEVVGNIIYMLYRSKLVDGTINDVKKYNLTKLHLHNVNIQFIFHEINFDKFIMNDALKVCSVLCPHVVTLKVNAISSQEEVLTCCNFAYLKDISLCSSHLVDYSPLLMSNGHSLVKIELISGVVSVGVLSKFCPKLENLTLNSVIFEELTESLVNSVKTAPFPNMSSLSLESMELVGNVAEATVFLLNCSPVLEYLYLPNCRCLNENHFITSVLKCECMRNLCELDLSCSDIKVSSVQQFLFVTQILEKLFIDSCNISSTEYEEIHNTLKAEKRAVEVVWNSNDNFLSLLQDDGDDDDDDYDDDIDFI